MDEIALRFGTLRLTVIRHGRSATPHQLIADVISGTGAGKRVHDIQDAVRKHHQSLFKVITAVGFVFTLGHWMFFIGHWIFVVYSHSIVLGGLELVSYTTRFTPLTSLVIRVAIRASTVCGSLAQSAVMPSRLVTARSAMTFA